MSALDDVRAASRRFYAALNRMVSGDSTPMASVWSHGPTVSTMHPIGGREVGWKQVAEPWKQVAQLSASGEVVIEDQLIEVLGEAAYEIGTEKGFIVLGGERVSIEQRVTNIYRREGRDWKIVHHHADLSPAMIELLGRLKAQG